MGGSFCLEKDVQSKGKENKNDIIEFKIKEIEIIHKKLMFLKKMDIIDKEYLLHLSKAPDLIDELKREIESILVIEEKDELNKTELLNRLYLMENEIITSIEEIITNISNKANDLSELAEKEKNKSVKKYEMCHPPKIEAINYVNNINNDILEKFIHKKNPSKKEFLILKLIFLIINPENKPLIPGLIIIKDLQTMENECFNKGPDIMKQKMIERLDNINLITSQFLEENKIFREYPYTSLIEMEKISNFYKNFFGYFNSLINYKRLYDVYEPIKKKYEQIKENVDYLIKMRE